MRVGSDADTNKPSENDKLKEMLKVFHSNGEKWRHDNRQNDICYNGIKHNIAQHLLSLCSVTSFMLSCLMTFSITHSTYHNLNLVPLCSVQFMLSIVFFIALLSVVMLNVIMLNIVR